MFRLLFLLFVYSIISLLGYSAIPAFASEAPCTETAETEPHPLRPAPARPCQKEPPKWNLSCANDAKPNLEVELPRTLDGAFNCSNTGDIGRLHCTRLIEKYSVPPVNISMDLTGMELPVAGIGSNTQISDTMPASAAMTNYINEYLQGDTEIKARFDTTAAGAGLIGKNAPASILLLGDSITQGYYPCQLNQLLKSNGYNKINFVGTQNPYYCSNVNSEGYAGYTTERMFSEKDNWLKSPADLSIIHLGTNDVSAGVNTATTINNLKRIISDLRSKSPNIKIILSQIIPLNSKGLSVADLNNAIAGLARETGSVLVNAGTGLNLADLSDGVHPNQNGGKAIAQNYFNALKNGESAESGVKTACSIFNPLECLLNFSGPIKKLIPKQVLNHYKEELIKAVAAGKTYDQIIGYVKSNKVIPRLEANRLFAADPTRTDIQKIRLSDMSGHINPPPGNYWYDLWLQTPFSASNNSTDVKGQVDTAGETFITPCLKNGRRCQSDSTVLDASLKITSGVESFRLFFPHLVEDNHLLEQMLQTAFIPKEIPNSSPQPEFPLLAANLTKADRNPDWTVAGGFKNADGCVKTDSFSNPGDNLEAKQNKNQGIITALFTFKKDIEYNYDVDTSKSLGFITACRARQKKGEVTGCPDPLPPIVKWRIDAPIPIFIRYSQLLDKIADQTVKSPGGIFQALYPEIGKTIGEIKDKPGETTISYNCTSSVPCTGGSSKAYFPWLGTVYDLFHQKLQAMLSPITNVISSISSLGNSSNSPFANSDIQAALSAAAARHNIPLKLLQTIYEIEGTGHAQSGKCEVSFVGATGPMQIMADTMNYVTTSAERSQFNRCNPGDAAELAARILKLKVGVFSLSNPNSGSISATDKTAIKAAARGYYGSCSPDSVTEAVWGQNIGYCDFVIYRMGLCGSLTPSCDGQ
ncbi:hypothetical protein HZB78_02920 [Candidatus Collierbacteria bacterium]|nr:hypothetical protein [Candidatus Collierbacteria bacterium]